MRKVLFFLLVVCANDLQADGVQEIKYVSKADNSEQPAMYYAPSSESAVPLIVALHTWSGDYRQRQHQDIEQWCIQHNWAYIHPNFRGPNRRPEATGSELVVEDIVSAVEYAKKTTHIDESAIYLVGTSGGGYTALVMAGHHPELWAGVSAWVPISDLRAWYAQGRYVADIIKSCGGAPGDNARVDAEYASRSPLTYLNNAQHVALHIHAGIYDGHQGSVPISHSLLAFNAVAASKDRLTDDEIRFFVQQAKVPAHLKADYRDPSYGEKQPLFRRASGRATVTIFDGGHELIPTAALAWIEQIHTKNHRAPEVSQDAGK